MWWIALAFVAVLVAYGLVVDWRARRRGRRIRHGMTDIRESRRDVHAWKQGSLGHSGEDVSWMKQFRRNR